MATTTQMVLESTHLSVWPIVFCKYGIIGIHRSISYEHDGLAADTSLSCVVELWKEMFKIRYISESLCIHKTSSECGP